MIQAFAFGEVEELKGLASLASEGTNTIEHSSPMVPFAFGGAQRV